LSDATAALDYDIAAEVLEKLDNDISQEELEEADPFEEGDLGLLSDVGLPEAVLGVILDESDLYADEQTWPDRAGRWASPTNCRPCSTASIGENRRRPDQGSTRRRGHRRAPRRADRAR